MIVCALCVRLQSSCTVTLRALSIINDELVRHQLRMIDAPISANDDIAWKQWASMHSKRAPHFEMPDVLTPSSAHVLGAVGHVPHVPSTALAATVPARSGPAASDARGGDAAVAFHSVGLGVAHGTRARSSAAQGGAAGMGPVPVLPGKAAFRIEYVTHGDADSEDRGEAVAASVSSASGVPCRLLAHVSGSGRTRCISLCCDEGACLRLYNAARHGSLTLCCSGVEITAVEIPQHRVVKTAEIARGGTSSKMRSHAGKQDGDDVASESLVGAQDAIAAFDEDAIVLLKDAFDASAAHDLLPFGAVSTVCHTIGYDVPPPALQKRYSRTDAGLTFAQLLRVIAHNRSRRRVGHSDTTPAVGASVSSLDAIFTRFARDGAIPAMDCVAAVRAAGLPTSSAEV